MALLDTLHFYLSHPSESKKYIREWELKFEERHRNLGINLVNPFNYTETTSDEGTGLVIPGGPITDEDPHKNYRILQVEKTLIAFCHGLLWIMDGNFTTGSPQESVYASTLHKPCVGVCTNHHYNNAWFRDHTRWRFRSFDELDEGISRVAEELREEIRELDN